MQANRLSKYNTQTTTIQKKVEIVKGKPMLKSMAVDNVLDTKVAKCGNKPRSGNFDFAGLAG